MLVNYAVIGNGSNMRWSITIGVNPAGDAGNVSPPIFWLVGTSMGMSPPIFRGGNVVEYEFLIASVKRKQR